MCGVYVIAAIARSKHAVAVRIAVLAFPDVQVLDVTGPLEVFAQASRQQHLRKKSAKRFYEVELLAPKAGILRSNSGLGLVADRAYSSALSGIDTLLVAGGSGVARLLDDRPLHDWLRRMSTRVRRLGSVCTGAFVLAAAGLLDNKRVATHWAWCDALASQYPAVKVEAEPIFVRDGEIYTSAGVTAGMDLALSLVEEDLGQEIALAVARDLVLFLRRPGGQSQFSAQLSAQLAERRPLRELQTWIADHLDHELSVPKLARRAHMSPRNFSRQFAREIGVTPARYIEAARVEVARRLLEETDQNVETIADRSGFGSMESMRRAFLRTVQVPPAAYRQRFNTKNASMRRPS